MTTARTSQAVEQMRKGSMSVLADRPTRVAIAEKYTRYEEDMRSAIAICGGLPGSEKLVNFLSAALAFDPLSQ